MLKKYTTLAFLCLFFFAFGFRASAVTYTAKTSGLWTDKIWLSSATNTLVSFSQITFKDGDLIVIDAGTNGKITITGTQTITQNVSVNVKTGTLFFDKPVQLQLNLIATLTVQSGAFVDANDSGNNILLTFGSKNDYNGKDLRDGAGYRVYKDGNDGAPLPVRLLSFSAQTNETAQVELTWLTASELNNDYFTVERSRDGRNFEAIATVKGKGTSKQTSTYSATDAQPFSGISYYRLSQTDFNGQRETFKYIAVKVEPSAFSIFPNPATSAGFSIRPGNPEEAITLLIYNHNGDQVYTQTLAAEGKTVVPVSVSLTAGMYWVKLVQATGVSTQRLVVAGM